GVGVVDEGRERARERVGVSPDARALDRLQALERALAGRLRAQVVPGGALRVARGLEAASELEPELAREQRVLGLHALGERRHLLGDALGLPDARGELP